MRKPEGEEVPVRVECQNLFQRESRSGPDKVSGAAVRDVIKLMEGRILLEVRVVKNKRGKVMDGWFPWILKIFQKMAGLGEERSPFPK